MWTVWYAADSVGKSGLRIGVDDAEDERKCCVRVCVVLFECMW